MENLLDKITSHIIMKLKNGDTNLTKQKIAMDLNITENVFDIVCMRTKIPAILSLLSRNTATSELIKRLTDNSEADDWEKVGRDFKATRDKIRQIEDRAFSKLNRSNHDKEPPDDAA